ncbi:hypothetical protein BCR34DRAFT_561828 [Clohesyomyces aquaticus]|uniref:Uncharacterized protein n=1 Tax=Clohesyomyces aquaticus TaxID=1231657 RepID=A0A1Y1ZTN2_9PLEO|nr:hypothetical protein BCR34DRAFT_561828 [Clohesyomyces aquaticus]
MLSLMVALGGRWVGVVDVIELSRGSKMESWVGAGADCGGMYMGIESAAGCRQDNESIDLLDSEKPRAMWENASTRCREA